MHVSHIVVLENRHYLQNKARLNVVNMSVSVLCSVADAGLSASVL